MSQTILAFDFGMKSIGVAVGQSITGTAAPLAHLKAQQGQPNWEQVQQLLQEWQVDACVVGLPLNMDGTEQPMTQSARKFANRLHGRFGVTVHTMDERLTTTDAKSHLFDKRGYKGLQKGAVDSLSAVLILQSWFENQMG